MELKEILEKLAVFGNDQPVPKEALAAAARQKEAITPILLDTLDTIYERVRMDGEDVCDDPNYDLFYYGIFLLAQFQEQKAFPKLLRILALDRDSLESVLGDQLGEMGKILYSTYDGDLPALKAVIENDRLDPFARGAALNVLDGILQDGRISREELIQFLRECLSALGDSDDERIFGAMVVDLIADSDFYELTEDVREAYRLEKIDLNFMGDFADFFDYLYNEAEDYKHTHRLEDAAKELSNWACFKSDEPSRMDILSWKVGRNDPCPCGSGKKFKKCCLPKQEELQIRFSDMGAEMSHDSYPPIERQGDCPGLSEFYSKDAIEVDRLAYQAFLMLRHPNARQKRERRRTYAAAQELLWEAFEKFRQICQSKGLDTPEAYDREHKLHYLSEEWLELLRDMLEETKDPRSQEVQAVLP